MKALFIFVVGMLAGIALLSLTLAIDKALRQRPTTAKTVVVQCTNVPNSPPSPVV